MEPMAIGTPSSSGPSSPATTPNGSPFLPSFLLGEPQSPTTSPKMKRVSFGETTTNVNQDSFRTPVYQPNQSVRNSTNIFSQSSTNEKTSGPPIIGLFDSLNSPVLPTPRENTIKDYTLTRSNSYLDSTSYQDKIIRSKDGSDSNWVTVFGYPPSATSFILMQMGYYGNIINKKTPAKGNWMHLEYSSKLDARRALSNNGKVFASTVMIGVIPCRDQGVLNECYNNRQKEASESYFERSTTHTVRSPTPGYPDISELYESPMNNSRIQGVRPLQQRFNDTEVMVNGNRPHKNTGLVSKALEYVFGW